MYIINYANYYTHILHVIDGVWHLKKNGSKCAVPHYISSFYMFVISKFEPFNALEIVCTVIGWLLFPFWIDKKTSNIKTVKEFKKKSIWNSKTIKSVSTSNWFVSKSFPTNQVKTSNFLVVKNYILSNFSVTYITHTCFMRYSP